MCAKKKGGGGIMCICAPTGAINTPSGWCQCCAENGPLLEIFFFFLHFLPIKCTHMLHSADKVFSVSKHNVGVAHNLAV